MLQRERGEGGGEGGERATERVKNEKVLHARHLAATSLVAQFIHTWSEPDRQRVREIDRKERRK